MSDIGPGQLFDPGDEEVEAYPHDERYSDSSLYDAKCINCGQTDRDGPIVGRCHMHPILVASREEASRATIRPRRSKPSYADLEPGGVKPESIKDKVVSLLSKPEPRVMPASKKREDLTAEEIGILQQGGTVFGRNAQEWGVGMRFNNGKPPVWRGFINYFPRAMEAVSKVSAFGASKYAWNNWQQIDEYYDNITDSLARHLVNEAKGRVQDIDSEELEAAHLAWNAMARLELIVKEREARDNG